MNDIAKLAIQVYKGQGDVSKYSHDDRMEVLRKELVQANGGSEKLTPKSFRKYPVLFEIMEEALDVIIEEGLKGQFDGLVETVTIEAGDAKVFTIKENRLFDVGLISNGNGDLRRDRLDSGEITVRTHIYGVAVYEEMARILTGRVDFAELVNNVAKSYENKIQNDIYNAVYESFNQLGATYGVTGTFSEEELDELIAHVEASTGMEALIMGTGTALGKVKYAVESNNSIDARNNFGYYGKYKGTEMMKLKQAHKVGTQEFAIDSSFLLVIPKNPDKFIKLVIEGESTIVEGDGTNRKDFQRDYTFIKKAGIVVLSASKYGIYRITT